MVILLTRNWPRIERAIPFLVSAIDAAVPLDIRFRDSPAEILISVGLRVLSEPRRSIAEHAGSGSERASNSVRDENSTDLPRR